VTDERSAPPPDDDLVFRRGKLRKRDDPAIDLFREALANPEDLSRVQRILTELARFYDPVRNGPVIDASVRRAVVEDLHAGRFDPARQRLEEAFRAYTRRYQPSDRIPPPQG
jgi:hypothetical protein